MEQILVCSIICLVLCGCRSAKPEGGGATAAKSKAKIYALEDVNTELNAGNVVLGGTREDARAFFTGHAEFHVCKELESFSVAVVRNKKVDPRADDIYIVTNFGRDGKIAAMEVGPPQFSVNNLASYCN